MQGLCCYVRSCHCRRRRFCCCHYQCVHQRTHASYVHIYCIEMSIIVFGLVHIHKRNASHFFSTDCTVHTMCHRYFLAFVRLLALKRRCEAFINCTRILFHIDFMRLHNTRMHSQKKPTTIVIVPLLSYRINMKSYRCRSWASVFEFVWKATTPPPLSSPPTIAQTLCVLFVMLYLHVRASRIIITITRRPSIVGVHRQRLQEKCISHSQTIVSRRQQTQHGHIRCSVCCNAVKGEII